MAETSYGITRMSREEFRRWVADRPEGERWERVAGELVAMAPERVAHVRAKARVWRELDAEIGRRGLPCEALADGITIEIDDGTDYEPDAVVNCGPPLPGDVLAAPNPVIIVEVLSPSTGGRDKGAKLEDYFRLPSLRHYLLVKTERPAVIHHRREDDGSIRTMILHSGRLDLDPPGIALDLAVLFDGVPEPR